jgi:transcription initiation factor TFIID subunit TAF12
VSLFDSEDDARTSNNDVRHQYRVLSDAEKTGMTHIKDMGLGLIRAIEANVPAGREASLAKTKVEEAVMWAVKGLTA